LSTTKIIYSYPWYQTNSQQPFFIKLNESETFIQTFNHLCLQYLLTEHAMGGIWTHNISGD